ncbi:hypothetical protein Dsin_008231 [Dipteronia sinensis]|uniref:Uncharacterized protein n=1 Tax=Dipteronia sinensis TaxID=43782 RepID=A0AAE0ANC1_9ROSI|nr:hypothetical protein Dsin_008231 [Dipteronia sinensis]
MDPRHTGEMLKHLEKQNELLNEVHKSMSSELHKLQVEEEMLMRKFYELMASQGLTKKGQDLTNYKICLRTDLGRMEVVVKTADDQETGHSTSLVCSTTSNDQQ